MYTSTKGSFVQKRQRPHAAYQLPVCAQAELDAATGTVTPPPPQVNGTKIRTALGDSRSTTAGPDGAGRHFAKPDSSSDPPRLTFRVLLYTYCRTRTAVFAGASPSNQGKHLLISPFLNLMAQPRWHNLVVTHQDRLARCRPDNQITICSLVCDTRARGRLVLGRVVAPGLQGSQRRSTPRRWKSRPSPTAAGTTATSRSVRPVVLLSPSASLSVLALLPASCSIWPH